ncbi:hypothetical protein FRX31_020593 [Thalictrum thalictroides]|uniref:Trichome birefringence-like C-terminal domain-containing protein n=1 Tax=Thalictrum thalictroides TaxID=46969 RepID=A0A7J6VXI5_THATH|nr:hypothetical protein FRX31_020593 [Thalictrum thalictroides]
MDTVCFRTGFTTWGKWFDSTLNSTEQKVFFQGISPSHYRGNEWNEPRLTNWAKWTLNLSRVQYIRQRK